jgi:hypothetical protein
MRKRRGGKETIRRVSMCGVYGEWEEGDGCVDIDPCVRVGEKCAGERERWYVYGSMSEWASALNGWELTEFGVD